MKKWFSVLTLYLVISSTLIFGQISVNSLSPERIILNLTPNPSQEMAVTWRTEISCPNSVVQYAEATPWIEFKKNSTSITAKEQKLELPGNKTTFHYSVIMSGLKPNTKYVYRVGHDSIWSEWNQFKTAKKEFSPVKFVFIGDPQNDIKEHCSRVFREAYKAAPDANFWLCTGDLAGNPYDNLWNELFYAGDFIFRTTPSILTPGNHDHTPVMINGKSERLKTVDPIWNAHFTLPENGLPNFKETSYYVDYQGVRFIMINSYDKVPEQAVWVEEVLKSNPNRWTVAAFHIPVYSMGKDRDSKTTRKAFMPLFDKYGVDLVLTGHDHTYARSKKIFNGEVVNDKDKGTVYVVSVSGPKMYELNPLYENLMVKVAGNISLFQVISINGSELKYESYSADGALFDSFKLTK